MSDVKNCKIQDLYSKDTGKRLEYIPQETAYFICPISSKYSAVGLFSQSPLFMGALGIGKDGIGMMVTASKNDYKELRLFGVLPTDNANVSYIKNVLKGKGKFLRIAHIKSKKAEEGWDEKRKKEYYDRVLDHMYKKFKDRNGSPLDSIAVSKIDERYFENRDK